MRVIDDIDGYLRKFGSFSLAASADQPGMSYLGDDAGVIAFSELEYAGRRTRVCLGEPLAPPELWPGFVQRLAACSDNLVFLNVGEEFCRVLSAAGMFVNSLGWEAIIDLDGYRFDGPKKQNIRNAVRRCDVQGYTVFEAELDDRTWLELDSVSQDWLSRKGGSRPENRLLTRPFMRGNRYQRIFAMRDPEGRLVHFLTIDEIWRDGSLVGYHSNINRGLETAPKNADYAIHAYIIEVLRQEGREFLSLGLCPDFGWRQFGKHANPYTTLALDLSRRYGRSIYHLDGITRHKSAFCPTRRRPVYVSTQNPWPLTDVLGVFRNSNFI